MDLETRYSREQIVQEYGQYYEFVTKAEFYAVNDNDSEDTKAEKRAELLRINSAVHAKWLEDHALLPTDYEDALTTRLVDSKTRELNGGANRASALICLYMNDDLGHAVAGFALNAYKESGKSEDIELFVLGFTDWVESVCAGKHAGMISGMDYDSTIECVDSIISHMRARGFSDGSVGSMVSALESLIGLGGFPENVYETITDDEMYGQYGDIVRRVIEINASEEVDEAVKARQVRELGALRKELIARSRETREQNQASGASGDEVHNEAADLYLGYAYIDRARFGAQNGKTLEYLEMSLYDHFSAYRCRLFMEVYEQWMGSVERGATNVTPKGRTYEEMLADMDESMDILADKEWQTDYDVSTGFADETMERFERLKERLLAMGTLPENVAVIEGSVERHKYLVNNA